MIINDCSRVHGSKRDRRVDQNSSYINGCWIWNWYGNREWEIYSFIFLEIISLVIYFVPRFGLFRDLVWRLMRSVKKVKNKNKKHLVWHCDHCYYFIFIILNLDLALSEKEGILRTSWSNREIYSHCGGFGAKGN